MAGSADKLDPLGSDLLPRWGLSVAPVFGGLRIAAGSRRAHTLVSRKNHYREAPSCQQQKRIATERHQHGATNLRAPCALGREATLEHLGSDSQRSLPRSTLTVAIFSGRPSMGEASTSTFSEASENGRYREAPKWRQIATERPHLVSREGESLPRGINVAAMAPNRT